MTVLSPRRLLTREAALRAELVLLFVGVPALMAVFFGRYSLLGVVWALALVAALLLSVTPGFRWRSVLHAPPAGELRLAAGFTVGLAAAVAGLVLLLAPGAFLSLPRARPELWLLILAFYPPLSAAPQELIFRALFFERYGALFRSRWTLIAANGLASALAHLFYMNPVTIALSGLFGGALGWVYLRSRSLLLTWALHAIGGGLVFTLGLGRFFYHGAI